MPVPPPWKIRRELKRLADQGARLSASVIDGIRKPIYDATAHWRQTITPGQHVLTDRVAVFVIFQPQGLAASIILTLRHLRQNGYSVLVVSNGPLQPEDHRILTVNSSVVMERPNAGYDFGGYRDGIRYLWKLMHDVSRLVLINDSTWFPLLSARLHVSDVRSVCLMSLKVVDCVLEHLLKCSVVQGVENLH